MAVTLPGGGRIADPSSPTGFLMSPVADLSPVAEAGRAAGNDFKKQLFVNIDDATSHFINNIRSNIGQGGKFDYQRTAISSGDYIQNRQFRNVSNYNVGLYMRSTGIFPQWETLLISGVYALLHSSNWKLDKPYFLEPQTALWIEKGYRAAAGHNFGATK